MKNSNDTIGNRTRDLLVLAQLLNHLRHWVALWTVKQSKLTEQSSMM
jgi:hypothetical protein